MTESQGFTVSQYRNDQGNNIQKTWKTREDEGMCSQWSHIKCVLFQQLVFIAAHYIYVWIINIVHSHWMFNNLSSQPDDLSHHNWNRFPSTFFPSTSLHSHPSLYSSLHSLLAHTLLFALPPAVPQLFVMQRWKAHAELGVHSLPFPLTVFSPLF